MDFLKIKESLESIQELNRMNTIEMIREFEKFSNQKIPAKIIEDFIYSGLSNEDFLMSDFLHEYGLKNLFEVNQ